MATSVVSVVRESPQLSVDVSELLRHPGASRKLQLRAVVEGLSVPLAHVAEGSELVIDVRVDALVDGVHVSGTVAADTEVECRRCLTVIRAPIRAVLDEVFVDAPGDADSFPIRDEMIDLEPAVRDVVLLELPQNPLCREDCRGLCLECGADRNQVSCGHDATPHDERWTPLAGLRERLAKEE